MCCALSQVGNVKAVNLAMVFIKELEKLDTEEKKVAVELVKSAIVYHVDGPDEQTKAEKAPPVPARDIERHSKPCWSPGQEHEVCPKCVFMHLPLVRLDPLSP